MKIMENIRIYLNGCEFAYKLNGFVPVVYLEIKNGRKISNGVNGIANKANVSFVTPRSSNSIPVMESIAAKPI